MRGERSNLDQLKTVERRGGGQARPDSVPSGPGRVADADIPESIARTSDVTAAINAHVALADPHAQYVQEGGNTVDTTVLRALAVSASPTQAEVQAIRDEIANLLDTLRVHA